MYKHWVWVQRRVVQCYFVWTPLLDLISRPGA